ncbi:hypothetical protein BT69DRAFT_1348086 [Atractiella rhizophila]|nr:hypothetical protein BT69DRAFT_1348086 [Atractiella rhizophila]
MKLLRLRFVRLPPQAVSLSSPLDLSFCLCDDYGTVQHLPFPITITLSLISLRIHGEAPFTNVQISPSQFEVQHLHKPEVPVTISFNVFAQRQGRIDMDWKEVCLKVVALSNSTSKPPNAFVELNKFVPDTAFVTSPEDNDEEYAILSTYSAPFSLNAETTSKEKVQCHFKLFRDLTSPPSMLLFEEKIHHAVSTGSKIWDGAIVLSLHLLSNPSLLYPSPSPGPLSVIELGCGCGLLGIVASHVLEKEQRTGKVFCTDEQETVDEFASYNRWTNSHIPEDHEALNTIARPLSWGALTPEKRREFVFPGWTPIILASDVQYNPDYHQPLLETIKSILHPEDQEEEKGKGFGLIAYRHRTEGDDKLFDLAEDMGLKPRKLINWGEVDIWKLE